MHVADIMPTLLEVAGASYPKTVNGQEPPPLIGKSWVKTLAGEAGVASFRTGPPGVGDFRQPRRPAGRLEVALAIQTLRHGGMGVVQPRRPIWRERHDLAAQHPEKVKALLALWDDYVRANNVILPNRTIFDTMEKDLPQRVTVYPGFPPLIYQGQFVPPKEMLADPKP
ncbi:MAG: hypothetical protein MZW92_45155 [Comamonadaceae bacterium]|nr:hypothetical protein [Comamonadaceae bacterium]